MIQKRYLETKYAKYMTDREWERIKVWLDTKLKSPSSRIAVYCMAMLGTRIGETLPIKRSQFQDNFSKFIYHPLKKRGRHALTLHEVYVPEILKQMLIKFDRSYRHRYRNGHLFFPFANQSENNHIQEATMHWVFKRMRRDLKMDIPYYYRKGSHPLYRISPHTLRHYFAYKFYVASGNCMKSTQERMCHEKITTTSVYVNMLQAGQKEKNITNSIVF
jgi:integrase